MASHAALAGWGGAVPTGGRVPAARLTRRGKGVLVTLLVAMLVGLVALVLLRSAVTPAQAQPVGQVSGTTSSVVVGDGDSLWTIAQRVAPDSDPRLTIERIAQLNALDSSLIHPGDVLVVPVGR